MKNSNALDGSIDFIESRLTQTIDIGELAQQAFFSKTHYQRLFRAIVGEPVMEYVKNRRLQLACRDVQAGNTGILDIALRYGYDSHEGFTRAFKAYFGVTPSEYRKYSHTIAKLSYTISDRMAIHTMKVKDFHSKLPSCTACRLAGRMAIHTMKVKDFHSNPNKTEVVVMLSNELLNRIGQNAEKTSAILSNFIGEAEKLVALANKTAELAGEKGTTTTIVANELNNLAKHMRQVTVKVSIFNQDCALAALSVHVPCCLLHACIRF